jgi:hypothetical protein
MGLDSREKLSDLVPWINQEALAGFFATEHEAVFEKGSDRACFQNHLSPSAPHFRIPNQNDYSKLP